MHKLVLNIIFRLETLRSQAAPNEKGAYTKAIMEVLELYDMACFNKAEKESKKKSRAGANCRGSNN